MFYTRVYKKWISQIGLFTILQEKYLFTFIEGIYTTYKPIYPQG